MLTYQPGKCVLCVQIATKTELQKALQKIFTQFQLHVEMTWRKLFIFVID